MTDANNANFSIFLLKLCVKLNFTLKNEKDKHPCAFA
jgi:hypothetical protein